MSHPTEPIDTMIPATLAPADAVTLSRSLLLAFDLERGADPAVRRSARALRDASDTLRVAWEAKVRAAIAADHGSMARRADFDEDAVWIALFHWLKGWATLPGHLAPERDIAHAVLEGLFPDGTAFTQLTYALEWAEAERRLAILDAEGHAARIDSLGGGPILRALRAAHREYERALGMSDPKPSIADTGRDPLAPMTSAVRDALEAYVRAVIGGDASRVDPLLAPLRRWAAEQAARR